jgi:AraC family transcriptional regulator, activator of mtrCDE
VSTGLDLVSIRPDDWREVKGLDVIEQLLANLEVGIGAFASCDIRLGHQLTFDSRGAAGVHYCLSGQGHLRIRNGKDVRLRQHTFVLLPPKVAYSLAANEEEDVRVTPRKQLRGLLFKESVPRIQAGDGALGIVTVCGEVCFEGIGTPGLFAGQNEPMVEHFEEPDGLQEQFIVLLAESAQPKLGTRPLTEALLKQCLVLLLRRKIERGESSLPWMAALAEPGLSKAMQAILQRYADPLTVEKLASIAGMSRSAFAARFTQAFGRTPMNLLRAARLRRAKELLATSSAPVAKIADCVGFSSRSNFSRAFFQAYGVDPSKFRTRW